MGTRHIFFCAGDVVGVCAEKGDSVKIDIYVTNDCKGVAVPTGTDIATLPQNVFELAKSARSTKHNIDTDDGCIGSGIVAALTGLTKDG